MAFFVAKALKQGYEAHRDLNANANAATNHPQTNEGISTDPNGPQDGSQPHVDAQQQHGKKKKHGFIYGLAQEAEKTYKQRQEQQQHAVHGMSDSGNSRDAGVGAGAGAGLNGHSGGYDNDYRNDVQVSAILLVILAVSLNIKPLTKH